MHAFPLASETRLALVLLVLAAAPAIAAYRHSQGVPVPPPSPDWIQQDLEIKKPPPGWGRLQQALYTSGGRLYLPGGGGMVRKIPGQGWALDERGGLGIDFRDDGSGLLVTPVHILRSTNWGESWDMVLERPSGWMARVAFIGPESAVIPASDGILRSEDGGLTWAPATAPRGEYTGGSFLSPEIGIAVGGGGLIVRTEDGGRTWTERPITSTALLRAVAFADSLTVVVVGSGGTILRSTDAGLTWTRRESPTKNHLRAVAFANAREGIAVGFYGSILRTQDGGATWHSEPSGTRNHLLHVTVAPDGAPLAVGWFGTVLKGPSMQVNAGRKEAAE